MDTILVTGGAGFIGSNFVRLLLERTNARVVVLDKLTYAGRRENLADFEDSPRFRFEQADIADRGTVRSIFEQQQPTAVINFAAESHVDRSIDDASEFIRTNIVGAFELLEAARRHLDAHGADEHNGATLAEAFRFVHVSTDEVYGSLGKEGLFTETTSYAPNSPYAASKAGADHLVRAYFHTHKLPALVTNCSNNYGPYQFPEKLIPLMILNAAEGKDLPIYGDGSNVRDWIHVRDHGEGVLVALQRGRPGEKYNFGGNAERSNLQVVDTICDHLEQLLPAADNAALQARDLDAYASLKRFVRDRPGHDWRYAIDASKAERELGWTPRHDFTSGLEDTVRWYLDNRDWCAAVQADLDARKRIGLGTGGKT